MEVLRHPRITRLDGISVIQGIGGRNPGFEVQEFFEGFPPAGIDGVDGGGFLVHQAERIKIHRVVILVDVEFILPQPVELTHPQPVAQAQVFGDLMGDIHVQGILVGVFFCELFLNDPGIRAVWNDLSRVEDVVDVVQSVVDLQLVTQVVLQVVFDVEVLYARIPFKPNKIEFKPVVVIGIDQGEVGEELIGEDVVPAKVENGIPVGIHEQIIDAEKVPSKIPGEEQVVLLVYLVIQFGVQVIEIGPVVQVYQGQEKVCIRSPSAYQEGSLVLYDGALCQQAAGNGPYPAVNMELLAVAFLLEDIEHGGDPPPVPRWDPTFVEFDVLDGIRVEDRKETKQVGGVEDNGLVQQDEVLVHRTPAHVEPGGCLPRIGHPREQDDGFDDVCLPEYYRDLLDGLHGKGCHAHLGFSDVQAFHILGQDHFLQLFCFFLQLKINSPVGIKGEGPPDFPKPEVGYNHLIGPLWKGERIKPVFIADGPGPKLGDQDTYSNEGFVTSRFGNRPTQGKAFLGHHAGCQQENE